MKRIKYFQVLIILLFIPLLNGYPSEINYNYYLTMLYNYRFDVLEQSLDSLSHKNPNALEPDFLKASMYWWYIAADPYNETFRKNFLLHLKEVIKKCHTKIKKDEHDYFILGATYGYVGRYYLLQNKWIKAYKYGERGKYYLEKIPQRHPVYSDALFGLGIYHYYIGLLPSYIKVLAFLLGLEGDKEKGLNELQEAGTNGSFTIVEAKCFLGFINNHFEKKYDATISLMKELTVKYPLNVQFTKLLSEALRKKGDYENAISICEILLRNPDCIFISGNEKAEFYSTIGFAYQEIQNYESALKNFLLSESVNSSIDFFLSSPWKYFNIAYCYEKLNKHEEAINYYKKVLKCEDTFGYHDRAKSKIKQLQSE